MKEKLIIFKEDESKPFYDLIDMANNWIRFNNGKNNFKHLRSIFDVKYKDPLNELKTIRVLKVFYTADTELIDPNKCDHSSIIEEIVKPATCFCEGVKYKRCQICGSIVERITIDILPHTYGNYEVIKEPTCISKGIKKRICIHCKSFESQEIPMIDHQYGEYKTLLEPTFERPGTKYRECKICKHKVYSNIDILPLDLQILTETIDGLIRGKEYSKQIVSNIPGCTFDIIDGYIEGIELSKDGILSGIPTSVSNTITISCSYKNIKTVIKQFNISLVIDSYIVSFDSNGGTCSVKSKEVGSGQLVGKLPIPEYEDKIFGGWFTAPIDGLKVDENYTINEDVTLYARWGDDDSGINFGDATTQFNISINGDRTNYNNQPYTFYFRNKDNTGNSSLSIQTGISSENGTSNMDQNNKEVTLYMKVNNLGETGIFDIGFDCDSYINGDDKVKIERLENGVRMGNGVYDVTVPYNTSIWVGKYSERTANRYVNHQVGYAVGTGTDNVLDSGYAFTMNDIHINGGSYAILQVSFKMP